MRTSLFVILLGVAAPAWGQGLPDSGLPDASVEAGSAQGMTEENDPQGGPCLEPKECAQGFSCVGGRCVPAKPKNAGCSVMPVGLVAAGLMAFALRRRPG